MKNFLLVILALLMIFMGGCSLLDKIAPAQYDESGQIIPGSRQPTELTKTVAGAIPYGDTALAVVLFLAAGYEKYRSYKFEKGLKATLLAGKQVATDPEMKEMWEKIREKYFRQAHENEGVTKLIKSLVAKLPSITKSV